MSKSPSYKKQLTLAVILIGLSSLVYWFEFSKKPAQEADLQRAKKVFAVEDPSVRRISILREDRSIVLLCTNAKDACKQKANTQWTLQEPIKSKADSSNAQSLLATLLEMGGGDSVSLKEETPESRSALLKSYLLDESSRKSPTAKRFQISTDAGQTLTATIGAAADSTNAHYVLSEIDGKANEDTIYLVPKHQVSAFDQVLTHWRDKRIVTFSQNEVSSVDLKWGSHSILIEKVPGSWNLVQKDQKIAADLDAMDTFISGVLFLNAKNFAEEKKDSPEGKKLLQSLKSEAVLKFKAEKSEQTLRVYSKTFRDGKNKATIAYATVDEFDPIFEIDSSSMDRIKKSASDFRLKKLLPVNDRGETRFIRFTTSGKKSTAIAAQLEGSEWKRVGDGKPVLTANLLVFLDRISGDVIHSFLPLQATPSNALRVEMGPSEKEVRRTLYFWKSGTKTLARHQESALKEIYLLTDDAQDAIPFEEAGLTAPRAAPPPAEPPAVGDEGHEGHGH